MANRVRCSRTPTNKEHTMETSKRHVGRPKASPQRGPLVLSERRTRTTIEIELAADAAEELAEYVRWVETSEGMSTADARAATIEFALWTVFKRDRLWQQQRHGRNAAEPHGQAAATPGTTPAVSPSPPPSPPRTLPPPAGRAAADRASASAPDKTQ
jgi:hypothetical protein